MIAKEISLLILLLPFSFNNAALAQFAGIYLSHNDYDHARISYTKKENLKYRIKFSGLLNSGTIRVVIGDSIIKLSKDSIFGYRDNENVTYRLYHQREYEILNTQESIILYSLVKTVSGKGNQNSTEFFFSTSSGSPILPLTKMNLKGAYPNNSELHELIDLYFKNDSELMHYDTFYQVYKINRIYQLNQKSK